MTGGKCAEYMPPLSRVVGRRGVEELLNVIANAKDEQVPAIARACVTALANKIARMVWAMMARGERYREPVALVAY
jgi:hypothetical protein